jgi:predicted N-formylglutamate amidohydrolase
LKSAIERYAFLVTCEHGGNRIPADYRDCFAGNEALLQSHRAYDPGALSMARGIALQLGSPLIYSTISRLLVDLNRSLGSPGLHSEAIQRLPVKSRHEIVERYYLPIRARAEAVIHDAVTRGECVIHISSHSFTPELDGVVRQADMGLLYDPARIGEVALCSTWQACLKDHEPGLRVRRNYPYTGKSDGFTAFLRRRLIATEYIGIELELNQDIIFEDGQAWRQRRALVIKSLTQAIGRWRNR